MTGIIIGMLAAAVLVYASKKAAAKYGSGIQTVFDTIAKKK